MGVPPNMADYEGTRRVFRLEVPERFNYVRDVIDERARCSPDALALVATGPDGAVTTRYTFAGLARAANRAANALAAHGVGKGDRVFVMLPRIPDWHVALLGCIARGAVPMPGTPQLTPRDVAYRVGAAEAIAAVTDAEGAEKVDEARSERPGLKSLFCVGGDRPDGGWLDWADVLDRASERSPEAEPTRSDDPMILYFT